MRIIKTERSETAESSERIYKPLVRTLAVRLVGVGAVVLLPARLPGPRRVQRGVQVVRTAPVLHQPAAAVALSGGIGGINLEAKTEI